MYLDRELQIIISTPISGVTEDIIVRHANGAGSEIQNWIEQHPDISAEVERLPKHMIALTIEQRDILPLLNRDDIHAAAIDIDTTPLLLQNRDELIAAARGAMKVATSLPSDSGNQT